MFRYCKFFILDAEKVANPSLWKSSSLCNTFSSANVTYPRGLTFAKIVLLNSDENPVSNSSANIIWREVDRELFADLLAIIRLENISAVNMRALALNKIQEFERDSVRNFGFDFMLDGVKKSRYDVNSSAWE